MVDFQGAHKQTEQKIGMPLSHKIKQDLFFTSLTLIKTLNSRVGG
jgi:hypothetical protein